MPRFRTVDAARPPAHKPPLLGRDPKTFMRGGHVDAVTRVSVSGWAADAAEPDARLDVRVEVDGRDVGGTVANLPRGDLAALGKYGDGAHAFMFRFPAALPVYKDHTIRVCFPDGTALPGGKRVVAGEAPLAIPTEEPAPILVSAPGRSGTTYLMGCLAAAPQIVVAELVPYEVRLLSYYAAAYAVLTSPADIEHSTHPDNLEGDGFHIGFNPFNGAKYAHAFKGQARLRQFSESWAPGRLGQAIAEIVREYYRSLAADKAKPAVRLFAEKNNNLHDPTRVFVRRVFAGMREVLIVRDPRDVACSHIAYFDSSRDRAFGHLSHSCSQITAIEAEAGTDLCIIRYEDMIRGEPDTYRKLGDFLQADVRPVAVGAGSAMFAQHATSASPEASIGRWRTDMPEAVRRNCADTWGGFLTRFGYDLA